MAKPRSPDHLNIVGDYADCMENTDVATDESEDNLDVIRHIESSGKDVVDAMCAVLREWPSVLRKRITATSKKNTTAKKAVVKKIVYMQVKFEKIGEIDTAKETFWASVVVKAKWREEKLDEQKTLNNQKLDSADRWDPRLHFRNYIGNQQKEVTVTHQVKYDHDEAYVIETRQLSGTFGEKLELEKFPFDIQEFSVTLQSSHTVDDVEFRGVDDLFEDDSEGEPDINTDSSSRKQEWRVYSNVSCSIVDKDGVSSYVKHPMLSARCTASRNSGFYVWNYMLVMFFITCICFCTFSVTKFEVRLQPTVTLLLTTMVFKNTVNTFLPRYSYLTYMDKYILLSMFMMGLICIWHAIAPSVDKYWADKGALIGLGAVYCVINIIYVCLYIRALYTRAQLEREETNALVKKTVESSAPADGSERNGEAIIEPLRAVSSTTPLTAEQYALYSIRNN